MLIKYSGKCVKIYFNMKITFLMGTNLFMRLNGPPLIALPLADLAATCTSKHLQEIPR